MAKLGDPNLKGTKLDDSASIYKKREEKSEKLKFGQMTPKEKWGYFREYYLVKCMVAIILAVLAVSFLVTVFREKPECVLSVAILDNPFSEEQIAGTQEDMNAQLVTEQGVQEVFFDTGYYISLDDYTNRMKLMTRMYASDLDIIIARESEMKEQAKGGSLLALESILPDDLRKSFSERYFYAAIGETDFETMEVTYEETKVYGVYLKGLIDIDHPEDPYVIGILGNAKNMENAIHYVSYLFERFTDK